MINYSNKILSVVLLLACWNTHAQKASFDDLSIDWKVQAIEAETPESLSGALVSFFHSDRGKARAIFSWITQHISYNTGIFNYRRRNLITEKYDPWDSAAQWKSGDEMTAWKVMRRRVAVCDGYAKLFKTLCDYAGLKAVVITGYAKGRMERNERFRTNHTWNAVMIDGIWQLLDVTWASGYINYSDEFVAHLEEKYFLSPPREFYKDHYPEDQRWTLLDHTPMPAEYHHTPFRCKSFVKYGIHTFSPGSGLIKAAIGDTIRIELQVNDANRNKVISSDPFFDSTMMENLPASVFLKPVDDPVTIRYQYVVTSTSIEWLNILYNDDMVLRYKLDIEDKSKNEKLASVNQLVSEPKIATH